MKKLKNGDPICMNCDSRTYRIIPKIDCQHYHKVSLNKTAVVTVSKSDGSTASYYELPKNCSQLQDLISYKNMNAQIGEIFRACFRYGEVEHSEMLRDAKKMLFYAKAEVKRLEMYVSGKDEENGVHRSHF